MTASPLKTVFTWLVCGLLAFNNPGTVQACWLTDWMWGTSEEYPVAPPVITTNYPVYPATVQANYQPSVVGSCPPPAGVTTAGYAPQMNYNSQYLRVPTTVYRPVPVYQNNSAGVPVVGYQGCTTTRYQVQRTPAPGYAAAPVGSSCGCASAGYNAPVAPAPGATITQPAPGNWVPRTDQQVPQTYAPPQTYQPQPQPQVIQQPAPTTPSYGAGGSLYSEPPPSTVPGPSRFNLGPTTQPQTTDPANNRPSLRPEMEGPALNSSSGASYQAPATTMPPVNRYIPQGVTSQRPTATTATPSSTAPAGSGNYQVTPVTPIPDPQFSTSGPSNEAPRLLDPRDKTAGLDLRGTIIPVGYEMASQPPRNSYRLPTASIQSNNDGWHSKGK
ncbi:hypothetical protein AB1L30_04150 [Bremerella sp. JC817]|uniref:hypothetical protein n=1 Tax=Bremerella sp. JC817 TaxID=3231756 RepID=UPI0034597972